MEVPGGMRLQRELCRVLCVQTLNVLEGIIDSVNRIWLSSMNQRRYRLNQDRLEKIQVR